MLKGKELVNDILEFHPFANQIAFWWLGQQGFVIKMDDIVICIDGFFENHPDRSFPPIIEASEFSAADFFIGTHDHIDHIDRASWPALALASSKAKFITPLAVRDKVACELGIGQARFIGINENVPYTDEASGLLLKAVPAAHEFLDIDEETGLHPYMGVIIEYKGRRVFHAGDTCKYEGLETKLKEFGGFDIAFLPINGRDGNRFANDCIGNMTYQEAVDLAGAIHTGLAVPAHFDMFAHNSENPYLFKEYLKVKYPNTPCHIPVHGERAVVL